MAAPRFLAEITGRIKQVVAIVTSAGASDGEKIVATNIDGVIDDTILGAAETGNSVVLKTKPDGTIDSSVLPAGLGTDTANITASEALAAGDFVNIWDDAGIAKVRKADAATEGKEAHGFVLTAVSAAASATVYFEGRNTQLTGLTAGARQYLSTTPGGRSATPPSGSGNVVQYLGSAYSATALNFEPADAITVV